jgi:dipeptidyl aminopeptidase/acylaminoacyl peptidase
MDRDIRDTEHYQAAEEFFRRSLEPGFGQVTKAAEPSVAPDGRSVAVTGTILERLEGAGHTRIAVADHGGLRIITGGPGNDRCPQWSPDGGTLAFLSDRDESGAYRLYLLRGEIAEGVTAPPVDGTVEYCSWSPDGRHILLGVAGRGADLAGGQGSGTTRAAAGGDTPEWLPEVSGGPAAHSWRAIWVYDVDAGEVRRVSAAETNVWEAAWLGPSRIAAVVSPDDPGEGAWYTANLVVIDIADRAEQVVFKPGDQLGWPAGSPGGGRLAVVEAVCSDRWIVAGDIRLIDPGTGSVRTLDTAGVDVAGLRWLDERRLGYVGIRGLESVVGWYDTDTDTRTELISTPLSSGPRYPETAFAADGTAALILESYERPQTITLVGEAGTTELASLGNPGTDWLRTVAGSATGVTWQAPDGLEIEGVLCTPAGDGPFPLVVHVHGGPVFAYRNRWSMGYDITPLLVGRGYAVLHPNPRGSSGRGQDFARAVVGDMGGADGRDILAGIDALVERGVADPARVGVTGGSYGGFMSSWLITQDQRFAAAVPVAPSTNWYSQHHTSNIGYFDTIFLEDDAYAANGRHHERSPVMYAGRVRTPTLLIAGALDRCTPPGQAVEFHNALREHGVESRVAVYPLEGHGVRSFPAKIDSHARLLWWFERHMPPGARPPGAADDGETGAA